MEHGGLARAFGHVLGTKSHSLVTMSDTWTWLKRLSAYVPLGLS